MSQNPFAENPYQAPQPEIIRAELVKSPRRVRRNKWRTSYSIGLLLGLVLSAFLPRFEQQELLVLLAVIGTGLYVWTRF